MATTTTQPERERSPTERNSRPYELKWVPTGGMLLRMYLLGPTTWKDSGITDWREGKKTGGCPTCGGTRAWTLLVSEQGRRN